MQRLREILGALEAVSKPQAAVYAPGGAQVQREPPWTAAFHKLPLKTRLPWKTPVLPFAVGTTLWLRRHDHVRSISSLVRFCYQEQDVAVFGFIGRQGLKVPGGAV